MRLAIVARDDDAQALHLEQVARARGHDVARVSFLALLAGEPMRFEEDAWRAGAVALERCDAVVVRQLPSATALLAPPDATATAADWYRRGKEQEARASFAWSALADLELRGVPMINPPVASSPFDHKPLQLAALRRAGLPVPPTLVTNDPDAARAFDDACRAAGHDTVVKPAAGGAAALLLDERLRSGLEAHAAVPAIFQRRARGHDVRVTVVGAEVVSSVIMVSDDADRVDYRAGEAWQRGEGRVQACAVPPEVAAMSVRAAATCHQVLSGLDWKHDAQAGSWALLEANAAPVTLGIEAQTGVEIGAAVVRWLEQAVRAGLPG